MKTKLHSLVILLALLAGVHQAAAQGTRFFRISGPAATTITAFNPDGTLVWSNASPGGTYTIQTASSLPGGSNWVDYVQIPTTNGVNSNLLIDFKPPAGMALIPAGVFTMGDTLDGESDAAPTNVYVSAFYMDVNLVSYSQWHSVYQWARTNGYGFVHAGLSKATNHPVQTVDWFDTVKWCNARSQQAGLIPVYYTDAGLTQVFTNGDYGTSVYPNWAAKGYRLPTEAEWEKAARGGLNGQRFPWGNVISESLANYSGNTSSYDLGPVGYNAAFTNGPTPYTSPVGSFPPNGFGLYDMAGNVYEWCWDWYATPYAGGSDPRGPTAPLYARVLRGGSWYLYAYDDRCASRNNDDDPYFARDFIGFRCVRGLFKPPAGMALIPAGSFTMGNSINDADITDASPTNVTVSSFYMDVNLVSLTQWQSVYAWAATNGYGFSIVGFGKAANHPVHTVDWYDAVKWNNARSQQAGLTPVYYTDAGLTQVYTNEETTNVFANWTAGGYRLPTEAEWEKAARGGLSGQRYPWGNVITESLANYYGKTGFYSYDLGPVGYNAAFTNGPTPYTSAVGYFAPNGYGLYDMAGNVFEWCWDWYGTPYAGGNDPRGTASGSNRILRGGSWLNFADSSRCALRGYNDPARAAFGIGFRCVRGL